MALKNPLVWRRVWWILGALVIPVGIVILYAVPPTESSHYPKCFFYGITGLHCPGCGTARCYHALLHGRLLQAVAYNFLAILALPIFFIEMYRQTYITFKNRPVIFFRYPTFLLRGILCLFIAYWILRNLPWFPFTLLAPHELPQ